MYKIISLVLFFFFHQFTAAQSPAQLLVDEAIEYHDPKSQWQKLKSEIEINSIVEREGKKSESSRTLFLNLEAGTFEMHQDSTTYKVPCDDCERAKMYNDYFRYLLGMPMKLKDDGCLIESEVQIKEYKGKKYRVITVHYDPDVGTYTWLFYFDIASPELILTEFSKDGTFQNGETIELNNKVKFQKMLLPGQLKWFVLPNRLFLAEENIKYKKLNNK